MTSSQTAKCVNSSQLSSFAWVRRPLGKQLYCHSLLLIYHDESQVQFSAPFSLDHFCSLGQFLAQWLPKTKDTNRQIRTTFSIEYCGQILVPNTKPGEPLLRLSHPFTICASGTKFRTIQTSTDVYELGVSCLCISIFTKNVHLFYVLAVGK